ncbi:sensor histidine kinase [Granulicella cerasi]|uniref:Sensor histidine kinase n=1 Tax=Granulicella cerasi TaxID=741063 RepID=A0ABW1ZDN3_9BACT|nr:ATP-binding protein [Granulicella cerasi]
MNRYRRLRFVAYDLGALIALAVALIAFQHFRDHTDPRSAWTAYSGTWKQDNALTVNFTEERDAKFVHTNSQVSDFVLDTDLIVSESDGDAGVIFRSSGEEVGVDAFHGYYAGVRAADATLEFGRADFGWQPMARVLLPQDSDLTHAAHLRVIAIGCNFGVQLRLADGRVTSLVAHDDSCIASGHLGLRSSRTRASWTPLQVQAPVRDAFEQLRTEALHSVDVPQALPYAPDRTARYEAALRGEAELRVPQAGVQPIVSFLMLPGEHPNVTLQGSVISVPPLLAIQDDTNALIVPHVDPHSPLKRGDIVIARGTLVSERFRSSLENADIHVLWSDVPRPPFSVTAAQLTSGTYRGRYIDLEGTLIASNDTPDGHELLLRDGDLVFRSVEAPSFSSGDAKLEAGSRLRVYGLATSLPQFTQGVYPFALVADRAEVVSAPPWWSLRHILLVSALFLLLLLAAQYMLHRLQQWQLESALQQREQLAFEMHDTLAQSFTGIAYQLTAAKMERRGPEVVQSHIEHALEMVQHSHRDASNTIAALRPRLRNAPALLEALEQTARRIADGGDLVVETEIVGRVIILGVALTDAFFRIGQEAISNAIHHGHCKSLRLVLTFHKREVELAIEDDGMGFAADGTQQGLGLIGMASRASKVRGKLVVRSMPSKGTTICVRAPKPLAGGLWRTLGDMLRAATSKEQRGLGPI